jgi:hypothetical protein
MRRYGTHYAALGTMTGSLAVNALASNRLAKAEPAAVEAEGSRMAMLGLAVVGLGFAAQAALKDRPELDGLLRGAAEVGGGALHAFAAHQVMKRTKREAAS